MALRQLLNRPCNSPDAVFRTIRDFLAAVHGIDNFAPNSDNAGPGYTVVDASYASGDPTDTTTGDWCVLKSLGEAMTYPHYLRLQFGATYHSICPYLHWDSTTHTGTGGLVYNNVFHNGAGQVLLNIHADMDEVDIVIKPQGYNYFIWHTYGRLNPDLLAYSGEAAQAPDAIAAGDNTVILLSGWPDWAVAGRKVYNWDTSGLHELTIVGANASSREITVATSYAKTAGSWLAEDMLLFASRSYYSVDANDSLGCLPPRTGNNLLAASNMTARAPNYAGVDNKYSERIGVAICVTRTGEYRGVLGLVRDSNTAPATQGDAWVDTTGTAWRVYNVYNNRTIMLQEAL